MNMHLLSKRDPFPNDVLKNKNKFKETVMSKEQFFTNMKINKIS